MMKIVQRTFHKVLLVMMVAFGSFEAGAQILAWDAANNGGGFGASPWAAATQNANVTTSGLVRGSAIVTSGTPATGAWGGSGGWAAGSGISTDANSFYFTVVAASGYKMSLSEITTATRRSNSGPSGYTLYYSVNGGAYTAAGTATTTSTSGTGGTANSIPLSSIPQLQDVAAGTVVKFRINPTGSAGNYYITNGTNSLRLNGTVTQAQPDAPVATVATAIAATGFTANWNAVTGATGYRLDVATDAAFTQMSEIYDNFAVSGTSQFVSIGIEANTTYYYRVRAEINTAVSPNSNTISGTTLNPLPATVTTTQILPSGITNTTAVSGGNVTNDGMATVTARGVVWATTTAPTTASSVTSDGTGTGIFTSNILGLSPNTQYYYRAYATNSTGTSYGTEYSFWTLANTPGSPAISNAGIFTMDIALDANGNPDNTLYAIMINGGSFTNEYVSLNGSVSDTPVWQTAAQWGAVINIDVLMPGTTYTFSAAAQNGAGVQTPWSATAQGPTNPLPGPTTLTILNNTIDFEPACLSTDPEGAAGSFVFEATNLSGSGMGLGTVLISGPDGAPLEGISFSGSADGTYEDGMFQMEDIEEGEDTTVYVRFDPTAGVSYGTLVIELSLIDPLNSAAEPITAEAIIVELPEASAAQAVCAGSTVANLTTTSGTDIKWYSAQTGGTALAATAVLATGTYYASQSIGDCESARIPVIVTVNPIPAAPVAAAQLFCGSGTVSQLVVTGAGEPVETTMTENFESAAIGAISGAVTLTTGVWNFSGPLLGIDTGTIYPAPASNGHELQLYGNAMAVSPEFDSVDAVSLIVRSTTTNGSLNIYKIVNGTETLLETHLNNDLLGGTEPVTLTIPVNAENVKIKLYNAGGTSYLAIDNIILTTTDSPAINWYDVATGGTPLEGTAALATGTYYVTQTMTDCESARTPVAVTVNPIPDAPTAPAQPFCGPATVGGLMVTTGTAPKWYAAETGGTALEITTALTSGTYYVSQTVGGCESARTAVEVTVNPIPAAPIVVPVQTFCNTATVADLDADGENVLWYTAATGGTALTEATAITAGTSLYYASQTINGCESTTRSAVAVQLNVTAAPVAAAQSFCGAGTVSELMAATSAPLWYSVETGGAALEGTIALATGTYYVSQTINGCESARTAVSVTVNATPAPVAEAQAICGSGIVDDLQVTGTALKWYAAQTGGTQLEATEALISGTYYVSQTINECEGPRTPVIVTVNQVASPVGNDTQDFEAGETLADLEAEGENLVWYAEETLETVLPDTTLLMDETTYYAVATMGECMSESALAVTVNEVLGTAGFDIKSLSYYPNPVNDVVNLSYSNTITSVVVYNLLGQPVVSKDANATTVQVDMSALAAGSYIMKVLSGNTTATIKLLKR